MNVILSDIPYRYDKPHYNNCMCQIILRIKAIQKYSQTSTVSLDTMDRTAYTNRALHLNNAEKVKYCILID